MKTKKIRIPFFILMAFLLNSCIIKSLQPFYIASSLYYEESLIGKWEDNKKGKWEVVSFLSEFKKKKEPKDDEDKKFIELYKNGYFIKYIENEKEAVFVGMPFKIGSQLFIDFNLFSYDDDGLNNIVESNLLITHTVAKIDILTGKEVSISWLDENKITSLIGKNQIQIKHEKVGIMENVVLTASSKELHKFLKKYVASNT